MSSFTELFYNDCIVFFSVCTCKAHVSHPLHLAHIVKRAVGEIVSSFSEKHNRHKVTELHPLTTDCPLESGHFRVEVHSLKTSTHKLVF